MHLPGRRGGRRPRRRCLAAIRDALLMGGEVSYERCPQSPTEMSKKHSSPKWKLWVTVCGLVVTLVLLFTFLALYIKERTECESQRYNHTSSAEGKMRGSDVLRGQLAAANQSLANITENWDSCKKELQHSRKNTSVLEGVKEEALKHLEAAKQSLAKTTADWTSCQEELKHWKKNASVLEDAVKALKHLEGEKTHLQNQLSQLNNNLENCKQDRNKKDKTIQHLKDQLNTRQTSSSMVLFPGLIPSFLLFIVPALCSLL